VTVRPRVLVLTLGGTISMTASDDEGATPTLGATAILQMAGSPADVDAQEVRTIPGAQLTLDDVLDVHERAVRASRAG
jgi:L-asparaginase